MVTHRDGACAARISMTKLVALPLAAGCYIRLCWFATRIERGGVEVSNLKPVLRVLSGVALTTVLSLHYDGALAQAPAESDEAGRGDSRGYQTSGSFH